jgi:hypothetical protein
VLLLLLRALNMRLSTATAWALMAICAGAVAYNLRRTRQRAGKISFRLQAPDAAFWALLGTVLLLTISSRLLSLRDAVAGMGLDAYHHTLIAWLIVERGGLPASYEPYAAIHSFAYHFGFHSLVAWLHWWTGAGVGELVGLAGLLVNAAVALGVAFFVLRVVGDGLVAALAAWLVALLCVFPAYFANWGRFTQASGLLLLPVAAALWIDLFGSARGKEEPSHPRAPLAAALAAQALIYGALMDTVW